MIEKQIEDLRAEMQRGHAALQSDINAKHTQNRADYDGLHLEMTGVKGEVQRMAARQQVVDLNLAPWTGVNGKPGKLDEMAEKMDRVIETQATVAAKLTRKDIEAEETEKNRIANDIQRDKRIGYLKILASVLTGSGLWSLIHAIIEHGSK